MIRFIRQWKLPIAIVIGLILAPWMSMCTGILPYLLFLMLFMTLSKIKLKELAFNYFHLVFLALQAVLPIIFYFLFIPLGKDIGISAMLCSMCSVATASVVVTEKLGGNPATLSTFVLLSNILTAFAVSIAFPLVNTQTTMSFWIPFQVIFHKLFILLILPFLITLWLRSRIGIKLVHTWASKHSYYSFYLWMISISVITGKTFYSMAHSNTPSRLLVYVALTSLTVCIAQFAIGRMVGKKFKDALTGGQALGQKNNILAIWLAQTYLNPIVALAPGTYLLWQNIYNGIQLAMKDKRDIKKKIDQEKANMD